MERKSFFVRFLMVSVTLFIFGLFVFNNSAFGLSEKEDILGEFRLAVANSLEKLIEATDENLMEYIIRIRKVEVAGKEYLVVYLIKGPKQKRLIWKISSDRLKNPGDIIKYAQEVAEVIIHEIRADAAKKQSRKNQTNFSTKEARHRTSFSFSWNKLDGSVAPIKRAIYLGGYFCCG